MINLRYFASLRDQLNKSEDEIAFHDNICTIDDLVKVLIKNNPQWQPILSKQTILFAVNQTMATLNTKISDGDEVAFFPPVTGG